MDNHLSTIEVSLYKMDIVIDIKCDGCGKTRFSFPVTHLQSVLEVLTHLRQQMGIISDIEVVQAGVAFDEVEAAELRDKNAVAMSAKRKTH